MFGWSKEAWQFRLLAFIAVVFIGSAVTSCNEIRYRVWGKSTNATLVKAETIRSTRSRQEMVLDYQFQDVDGTVRKEQDNVSADWAVPEADESGKRMVLVQYIPGSIGSSRVPTGGRWILVGLFVVAMIALIVQSTRFYIEFQAHQRRMARGG